MGSEFDGGPADGQNLTVPYLTEGPSRAQNLTYYPPLTFTGHSRFTGHYRTLPDKPDNRTPRAQARWRRSILHSKGHVAMSKQAFQNPCTHAMLMHPDAKLEGGTDPPLSRRETPSAL